MYKIIVLSVLFSLCMATDLAPIAVAAPAITSYQYETRQVHPGHTIALAAPVITKTLAAPLTLSAPLHAQYGAPLVGPALYSAPLAAKWSAPLLAPGHYAAPALLSQPLLAPNAWSGSLLSAPLLIKK